MRLCAHWYPALPKYVAVEGPALLIAAALPSCRHYTTSRQGIRRSGMFFRWLSEEILNLRGKASPTTDFWRLSSRPASKKCRTIPRYQATAQDGDGALMWEQLVLLCAPYALWALGDFRFGGKQGFNFQFRGNPIIERTLAGKFPPL
jgi:hypothetical protein